MIFWREKEKKCASRFEAKKVAMAWRHNCTGTGYSSTVLFWLFREINGDKVATAPADFLLCLKIS
jgi:hypothetical protein